MPIKVESRIAWGSTGPGGELSGDACTVKLCDRDVRVRIVAESDWRKIMALLRAAEYDMNNVRDGVKTRCMATCEALDELREK
jgi:hypothetical protein